MVLLGVVGPEPGSIASILLGKARGTLAFLRFGMMGLHRPKEKNNINDMKMKPTLRPLKLGVGGYSIVRMPCVIQIQIYLKAYIKRR